MECGEEFVATRFPLVGTVEAKLQGVVSNDTRRQRCLSTQISECTPIPASHAASITSSLVKDSNISDGDTEKNLNLIDVLESSTITGSIHPNIPAIKGVSNVLEFTLELREALTL